MERHPLGKGALALAVAGLLWPGVARAGGPDDAILQSLESKREAYTGVARQIWGFAELGYKEQKSSARLQQELTAAGFSVKSGVAGIPTAFVATFGSGKPIVGFSAEFDALPGLAQEPVPERKPIGGQAAGHACGHNLLGTGAVAAAIAVKDYLATTRRPGTIRLYGTPAEEGGAGKVYMIKAGLYNDVDVMLDWHPYDRNDATPQPNLAVISAKFRFTGVSSHAASSPWRGRSALDGLEAMTHMINMMREHVPPDTRLHYQITRGGDAPNIVPGFAELYMYARHSDMRVLDGIWERVLKTAEGAAIGTGTKVAHEIVSSVFNVVPSEALSKVLDKNLRRVGVKKYAPPERAFADKIYKTFVEPLTPNGSEAEIESEPTPPGLRGSSDMGDVSWIVPTGRFLVAAWAPGTPSHTWQAVAASGMQIGYDAMMVAAKTLALSARDIFENPTIAVEAKQEFLRRRGADFTYKPRVQRDPPFDYRDRQ